MLEAHRRLLHKIGRVRLLCLTGASALVVSNVGCGARTEIDLLESTPAKCWRQCRHRSFQASEGRHVGGAWRRRAGRVWRRGLTV